MHVSKPGIWRTVLSFAVCILLAGCISYQPRVLVPNLTLSPEDFELNSGSNNNTDNGVDFGIETVVNESDSLFNVEVLPGIRVRSVDSGGPSDVAGIQPGDVILSVNGVETNQPDSLAALAQQAAGQTEFAFQLRRNTAVLEANVVARPASRTSATLRELYRIDPIASRAGYQTELVNIRGQSGITAARVVDILPDSPLTTAGINLDDLVLAVNGVPVESAQGLVTRFNRDFALGDRVTVSVYTGDQLQDINLTLWNPGRRISRISMGPIMQYESSLNPQSTRFSLLDLWLFAVYRYQRTAAERQHSLFGIFSFSTDYGELVEETDLQNSNE